MNTNTKKRGVIKLLVFIQGLFIHYGFAESANVHTYVYKRAESAEWGRRDKAILGE